MNTSHSFQLENQINSIDEFQMKNSLLIVLTCIISVSAGKTPNIHSSGLDELKGGR